MNIVPIKAFTNNYIWALINEQQNSFICVDPGEARPVLEFAHKEQLNVQSILITHHHADHIGGIKEIKENYPSCSVFSPQDERIPLITHPVKQDQIIPISTFTFRVLFNPGHTSTHISYFELNNEWLFCGDTLFSAGCGRVFDGTMEQLHQSLQLFKSLPPSTQIFCAHEYTQQNLHFAQTVEPTNKDINQYLNHLQRNNIQCSLPSTLERELLINPFLRTNIGSVQEYAQIHGAQSTNSLDVFRVLRDQKDHF